MANSYDLTHMPATRMRRPELAQDDEWIRALLSRVHTGHIATHWDEQPFITPTNFWYDPERHEIYFHSNITGRVRANSERHSQVCLEASESGKLLPSNTALEFSIQYESVIVFGTIRLLEDPEEQRRALYGLISKYFPGMVAGEHYRPITDKELKRTSVYAFAIDGWSTQVDLRHLAATPVGMRVTARYNLTEVDRRRLSFTFEVHDELDKIGEGTHERFIIDRAKQQQRIQEKLARWKSTPGSLRA